MISTAVRAPHHMPLPHLLTGVVALLFIAIAVSGNAFAQDAEARYDALLRRVKAGDTTVDFGALRLAFSEREGYNAYDYHEEFTGPMGRHFREKRYDSVLYYAGKVLEKSYVDIGAHAISGYAYEQLKDSVRSLYHYNIRNALVRSILRTGNGNSPSTALVVISVSEEYAVLAALGFDKKKQDLVSEGEHTYDKITAVDSENGKDVVVFFNVDIPLNTMSKRLEEMEKKKQ